MALFPVLASGPSTMEWGLESNTLRFESPLSGSVQTLERPGARWRCTMNFDRLTEDDSATLQAFLVSLRGQAGRFTIYNIARPIPRGTISGTPLVNGADQLGSSLTIDGFSSGDNFKAGDFFTVVTASGNELKMVTQDITESSGSMNVKFDPPLRQSPSDNSSIFTDYPTTTMMLTEDSIRWVIQAPVLSSFTIDCIEAF